MKTLEEIPLFDKFINETPIDFLPFGFIPRSIFIWPLFERPLKTSCTIEELFDDLDDGSIDTTLILLFALCLAQRHKKALVGRQPKMFFLLFLVKLMIVTTLATSLYLYFQALCQV